MAGKASHQKATSLSDLHEINYYLLIRQKGRRYVIKVSYSFKYAMRDAILSCLKFRFLSCGPMMEFHYHRWNICFR